MFKWYSILGKKNFQSSGPTNLLEHTQHHHIAMYVQEEETFLQPKQTAVNFKYYITICFESGYCSTISNFQIANSYLRAFTEAYPVGCFKANDK